MSVPRRRPAGASVVEALVALLLGWLVAHLALATLAGQRAVLAGLSRRADALVSGRVARQVLGAEVRARREQDAAGAVAGDSLALRAFRGRALVCPGGGGADTLAFTAVAGIRAPDPAKDSVILYGPDGPPVVVALLAREAALVRCWSAPAAGERWVVSAPAPAGAFLARYFERGSYHLADGALRYRRGAAGRQPLTPEALRTPESRFVSGPAGVHVVLHPAGRSGADPWWLFLPDVPPGG